MGRVEASPGTQRRDGEPVRGAEEWAEEGKPPPPGGAWTWSPCETVALRLDRREIGDTHTHTHIHVRHL